MTILSSAEAPPADAAVSRYTKWVIALFFVVLFIPGSFYMGVRMTPIRFYLIVMAIPMALRFLRDPGLRITPVDALVFLAIFWRSLALVANHRMNEVTLAGSSFIELFFAYMLGRVFIRTAEDYRFFFRCFAATLLVTLPFALVESATRVRLLRRIAGVVLVQPAEIVSGPQIRFGLMRVQAFLEHSVVWGMFCSIGFANLYYLYHDKLVRRGLYTGFAGFMTLLAISSSSILTLAIQGGLIVYEKALRPIRSKWFLLGAAAAAFLLSFELIFSMSIGEYIATELALNQAGAETRLDQITYGLKEVWRNPLFGIGLDTPALPFWRSDIFDNFWLHTAVRYGAPSFLFIAAAFAAQFLLVAFQKSRGRDYDMVRLAYQIPLFTTVVLIGSVPLWGSALVFVMVYLGAGSWLCSPAAPVERARRAAQPRRRGAAPPGARPERASARPAERTAERRRRAYQSDAS